MQFTDTCIALQIMGKALIGQFRPLYNPQLKKRICKAPVTNYKQMTIDIGIISAAGFALNCQDLGATLFSITLEEIDYKIQNC